MFVTGHTGFKGSWLAMWLQCLGAEVTGYALAPEPESLGAALGIERLLPSFEANVGDVDALRSAMIAAAPTVVFHLAAQALVRRSYLEPLETLRTNVFGTACVLEAVRSVPSVRAVVVVTSDKCYENDDRADAYREGDALGGHDPYSASKAAAELVTAAWRRSFLASADVAVASVRAGNVVGGGDWSADRLVPDCIRAFAAGRSVHLRSPAATRPWQHVLDPLCGYLLLAERLLVDPGFAEAWNFGPDDQAVRSVADVVGLLAAAWGGDAAWSGDAQADLHEAGRLAVDSSLACARLGWQPRLPLPAALSQTACWYRRQLAGEDARSLVLEAIDRYGAEVPV